MRSFVHIAIVTLALGMFVQSCGNDSSNRKPVDTPRRIAYPRIDTYDTVYTAIGDLPVNMEVNAGAVVSIPRTENEDVIWIDVDYPRYKATLHCTVMATDPQKTPMIVDNRTQRMSLNLGENAATQLTVRSRSGVYDSVVLTTTGQTLTPVQFLSVGQRWIVSGALQWHDTMLSSADSISPIVDAVTRDVTHTVLAL